MQKVFLHVDLDAFFASVEQLDHPEYRGKPVIVGGLPGDRRAVVSTASYEARQYGVHSAMPLAQAVRLCPFAIFVRGNYQRYHYKSEEVMAIFGEYTPEVTQISVDEAFLNLTGTERLFGAPKDTALHIKEEVRQKTGLTVSIGLSESMYVAKIASGLKKPNGFTEVPFGKEEDFMLSLPLEKLWGAGTKTLERLKSAGIRSTKDIHRLPLSTLQTMFGSSTGSFLYNAVRGNKDMTFGGEAKNHSISAETTFDFDLYDRYAIETALMNLSRHVLFRMHKEGVRSRTVAVKIRYEDFTTVSAQTTEDRPIMSEEDMFSRITGLFYKKYQDGRGIRLLGVACENVEKKDTPIQGDLFDTMSSRRAKVEKAIYDMQDKNPALTVKKARLI